MPFIVGLVLALAVGAFAYTIGFDRDRAFYPTVAMVSASYYVLFAAMGASTETLLIEIAVASGYSLLAVIGFKTSFWWVVAAIAGHGIFDLVRSGLIQNPGVPVWWPSFCLAFDVGLGAFVSFCLLRRITRE